MTTVTVEVKKVSPTTAAMVAGLNEYSKGLYSFYHGYREDSRITALLEDTDKVEKYTDCFQFSLDDEIEQVYSFVKEVEERVEITMEEEREGAFVSLAPDVKVRQGLLQAQAGLLKVVAACEKNKKLYFLLFNLDEFENSYDRLYNPFAENGVCGHQESFSKFAETFLTALDKLE